MEKGCKKFLVLLGAALYFLIPGAEGKILRYPYGCYPMGYKFNYYNLILQPTGRYHPQTIYFIHNVSKQAISLFQARSNDEPYIIHINTTIAPNAWSVLATDEKKVKYICTNGGNDILKLKIINCSKVLDICEFPRTRFGDNNRGNYWAVENIGSSTAAVSAIRWYGILLIDPKKRDLENEGSLL
ncbi:enhanced entry protein [Coxiella burnetii]|uniref:Enhanced entry protein n=2 Tax=Coxiella burnetii TaxID=777 RepID=Q83CH8_COXBU|nr:enhanced entry protein [Coxiella burnetii]NP_820136.1 enhanced entry protein [Coxiella burnetii RSA 493]AAO90650.1 enhanced entry protein [Coxiella burnetii RSA 493]ABS77825.1 enhanced entry protein [Coxiella burnetii Dugway 5J108-111]ABX79051.1 enhanced entry protein EnhB [Coxiella burnetii RSA 331]ACJ18253.1 enhanced entry protein [Coxiella burnetii CbuG_Q212]AML49409.1 enhanced entry protein [Coxiella burnetii]